MEEKVEEKVFAIKFRCGNCGAEWEERFCEKDRIKSKAMKLWVEDHRGTRYVSCPTCRQEEGIACLQFKCLSV